MNLNAKISWTLILLVCLLAETTGQPNDKKGVPNLRSFDEQKLHFGFLIGFNTTDFRIYQSGARTTENGQTARYAEMLKIIPGINLGIVSNLRLAKNLDLRFLPGIGFSQRDLSFIDEHGVRDENTLKIKSTFLEFPLLLKYSALRMHNAKPYLITGINTRYDLAKDKQDRLMLKSLDYYWDIGAGMDFYLNYFRLSVEIRGSIGFNNVHNAKGTGELLDRPYSQAIDKLKSRWVGLTFYFE